MKLEKLVKVAVSIALTGVIVYKAAEQYAVYRFEKDMNNYLERARGAGL